MKIVYIQSVTIGKKLEIPIRITVGDDEHASLQTFLIRPAVSIPKRTYVTKHMDRMELLSAPPFCDHADDLIELFQHEQLVFTEHKQFALLKSQFKSIGYNFNLTPKLLWHNSKTGIGERFEDLVANPLGHPYHSTSFAALCIEAMRHRLIGSIYRRAKHTDDVYQQKQFDLSRYRFAPGVYFFLDASDDILYVGKAKNIRKRLQSHFSNSVDANAIDYSGIKRIEVTYTGNDIIAQLIESDHIKQLQPVYNRQQITDADPYIINKGETANGIHRLKITRKDITDNMPERYFNRQSVKEALDGFCASNNLCRKNCGLEHVKGPCSNVTERHKPCVCNNGESIADYNQRFDRAFLDFKNRKSRKIYKLKGRTLNEDAFIYTINDVYQGYGFIDQSEPINTENDLLGHLIPQRSTYDTSRILSSLLKNAPADHVLVVED